MRGLLLLILGATIGCQASPLAARQALVAPAAEPPRDSTTPDVLLCSASTRSEQSVAASDPTPERQTPAVLPSPTKVEDASAGDVVPVVAGQQPLTFDVLERLALGSNPTIPQAQGLVQQQQGLMRQVGLYPNPQAGYLRTDADQSGQSQTAGVFLSQEFVTAGKLRLARQAERQDVKVRDWQLTAQQARVLNDVRIRAYELLGAQLAVRAATELVELAESGVKFAEQLLQANRGSRPDVLQAKIQLSLIRVSLRDAQYRHRAAWQQLVNVVGVPDLPPAPLAGKLDDGIPELDWQTNLQELLASSPLLKAQEGEIRAAQYEIQLAKSLAIPNVNVQVVAQRDHIMKYSTVSTLVSLPVPLFNRNQGGILTARGVLMQQQKEYERIRLALSDQLAASFRQYSSLRNQVEQLDKEILPQAKENLELTNRAYQLGRFDFLRVLTARQTYFQANLARIDALTELHKVVVEIQGLQLTGGLNPTEIGTALQTTPGAGTTGTRGVLLQQLQEQRGTGSRNLPGAIQGAER